jgi:hypothetical protein
VALNFALRIELLHRLLSNARGRAELSRPRKRCIGRHARREIHPTSEPLPCTSALTSFRRLPRAREGRGGSGQVFNATVVNAEIGPKARIR